MLAGVWLIYACFGLTVAAMAPLVAPIVADLGMSLAAMGAVLGAWQLVYIATAIPAGAFVDRFGLRRTLFAAALLIAASGAARAAAVDELTLFAAVACFGLGGPLVSIGAPKLIGQWFDSAERGLAMGIYITGPAIGGIAALALTNSVLMPLTGQSWRAVLAIYAGITGAAGLAWLALGAHPASRAMERAAAAAPREPPLGAFSALARLPAVRLVLAMSVGIFFVNHALNNWLPEILRTGGMDPVRAGFWASIPTAVGIAGALLIPRLATPPRRVPLLLALFAAAGLATALLHASAGPALAAGLVLQGLARSSLMTLALLVLMDTHGVGERRMGAAGGMFFAAAEVGGVLGPLGVGLLAHASGDFSSALWTLTGACALLFALGLWLGSMQRHGEPRGP